ncbi:GIY-YIG nuclease family protein [Psychromonas sp. Urea-02u-13]|uniref:GIY-YIG nuclease family protein n=1 Tax=Psychromonas sp. Urea-02u-13 TaxID=2058326 RepID=UPI000C34D989|nr:GIY-YIG nuclease family protein [Psychromonas sp. Urea-02u-13]PKG37497.1 hypothetical protein CXF74_18450 [Psychromonas sp. Urea-02u-13]
MAEKQPCTYMLSNKKEGVLYIGVTSNLRQRIAQHKAGVVKGFSQKYNLKNLVYFEMHETMFDAITREKQLKHWNRTWKVSLINKQNPEWQDLSEIIY